MPGPDDVEARQLDQVVRNEHSVRVDVVVGTPAEQIAVVTGVLRRTWMENGRRYVHYGTEEPVPFGASVFSARYEVVEDRWNDVELQIFHHPDHQYNVPRMMEAMKTWVERHREDPAGHDPAAVEAFADWVSQRAHLADQTASLSELEERRW